MDEWLMDGWIDGLDGWMDWMDEWLMDWWIDGLDGWMDWWMDGWIDGWTGEWIGYVDVDWRVNQNTDE